MLSPKKTKYRKQFKGKIHGLAKAGFTLNFGSYGLKSVEPERITARQIEAARRAITRQMKRQGRVWIRIFPDVPVTDKPAEVRMGKGRIKTHLRTKTTQALGALTHAETHAPGSFRRRRGRQGRGGEARAGLTSPRAQEDPAPAQEISRPGPGQALAARGQRAH